MTFVNNAAGRLKKKSDDWIKCAWHIFGKNMSQRATELVKVAHPYHREVFEEAVFERFHRV
jgi:hypothetical protein